MASSNAADQKLLHLVRKLISFSDSTPNADYIVTVLRTQHREYLRKDLQRLTIQVQAAVQQILAARKAEASRKRKTEAEDSYDREASENDAQRQQVNAGGGLNASLRDRYRQVQQERDIVSSSAETSPTKNTEKPKTVSEPTNGGSENSNKKEKDVETPKLKRRKVKSLKSSSISISADASFLSPIPRPTERYSDMGGMQEVIQQIRQLVEYPLIRPELYHHLGVDPPQGVLLRGPSGTGKTHLANAGTDNKTIVVTKKTGYNTLTQLSLSFCSRRTAGCPLLSCVSA